MFPRTLRKEYHVSQRPCIAKVSSQGEILGLFYELDTEGHMGEDYQEEGA